MIESSIEQVDLKDKLEIDIAADVFEPREEKTLEENTDNPNSSSNSDGRNTFVVHFGNGMLYLKQMMLEQNPPMIIKLEDLTPEKRKKIEARAALSKKEKEEQGDTMQERE